MPAAQSLQAVQLVWFSVAVKVPGAQSLHVRSAVAVPSVETCLPASQIDHATHVVAGFAS